MTLYKLDLDAPPPDWIGMSWGVIDGIMEGDESMQNLCETWGIAQGKFYRTTMKHQDLGDALQVARKVRAQRYADQAIELTRPAFTEKTVQIVDPATGEVTGSHTARVPADWQMDNFGRFTANTGLIQRDALRIKTLLHLAAKLDPEQFGDRIIEDHRGAGKAMLVIGDTAKAAALIAQARLARLGAPTDAATKPEEQPAPTGNGPQESK